MTDRAQPGAVGSIGYTYEQAEAVGHLSDGYIQPSDDPTVAAQVNAVDQTLFDEFDATHEPTSLDVTIAPSEAFHKGWFATDEETTVTLDAEATEQTVYAGYDASTEYNSSIHEDRDDVDDVIVGLETEFADQDPHMPIWEFDTDTDGVTAARDLRRVGRRVDATVDPIRRVVEHPDRYQAAEIADGDSHEVPIPVPDGKTLEVYRWGVYDADDHTAPTGLDAELLDGGDVVQVAENTTNTQDRETPVASHENTSGSTQVFVLRAKNDTGSPIGDGDNDRGVGMHFGYVVV